MTHLRAFLHWWTARPARRLLAIAFAAKEPDDPPPRVLALVDRPPSAPAETPGGEKGTAPPTTALLAAVRCAHAKGETIGAQVSWSDDPALDIITVAQEAGVAWILLGYHRAPSGSDAMGGVGLSEENSPTRLDCPWTKSPPVIVV